MSLTITWDGHTSASGNRTYKVRGKDSKGNKVAENYASLEAAKKFANQQGVDVSYAGEAQREQDELDADQKKIDALNIFTQQQNRESQQILDSLGIDNQDTMNAIAEGLEADLKAQTIGFSLELDKLDFERDKNLTNAQAAYDKVISSANFSDKQAQKRYANTIKEASLAFKEGSAAVQKLFERKIKDLDRELGIKSAGLRRGTIEALGKTRFAQSQQNVQRQNQLRQAGISQSSVARGEGLHKSKNTDILVRNLNRGIVAAEEERAYGGEVAEEDKQAAITRLENEQARTGRQAGYAKQEALDFAQFRRDQALTDKTTAEESAQETHSFATHQATSQYVNKEEELRANAANQGRQEQLGYLRDQVDHWNKRGQQIYNEASRAGKSPAEAQALAQPYYDKADSFHQQTKTGNFSTVTPDPINIGNKNNPYITPKRYDKKTTEKTNPYPQLIVSPTKRGSR